MNALTETIFKGSKSFQKLNAHLLTPETLGLPPRDPLPRAEPKQAVRDAALGTAQRETRHTSRVSGSAKGGRYLVRITSFRRRLLDFDNLAGGAKYFLDCCRFAGCVPGDSPEEIDLVTRQEKVGSKEEERTEIEILPLAPE